MYITILGVKIINPYCRLQCRVQYTVDPVFSTGPKRLFMSIALKINVQDLL